MKIFGKKSYIFLSLTLALIFGLMFCLPTKILNNQEPLISGVASATNAYVDGSSTATTYLELDNQYAKLDGTNSFNGTISTNSMFTIYIGNTFTATSEPVSYSIALTTGLLENSPKFALSGETKLYLLDYSNDRTGIALDSGNNRYYYTKTLGASQTEIPLTEFANTSGGSPFAPATIASDDNTEELQFILDFSSATTKPTAGTTYYFMLYRTVGDTKTVVGYKTLTFTNEATSFTFTATPAHATMLSDSTESITLNFAPTGSYSGLNGSGWGVRFRVTSPANTTLPSTTRFILKYGGDPQGDTTSLEKSFAFDFTQASYTLVAEVMIPYGEIASGNYAFAFDIFDKSSQSIIATATASYSFVNVNYKVKATTYIQTDINEYEKSVVYRIGDSLAVICHIIENNLPAGTTMKLSLEQRNANQTTFTLYDNNVNLNLDITQMRTRFITIDDDNEANDPNKIYLAKAFSYGTAIESEMVLRFHIEVYDRNGDLQSTTNSYIAVVEI